MTTQSFQMDHPLPEKMKVRLLYISQSSCDAGWHSSLHTHHCTEIFYVIRGHGLFQVENKTIEVQDDDLIIINANIAHTEKGIPNVPFEYIVLGIEGLEFFNKDISSGQSYSLYNYQDYKHEVLFYLRTLIQEVKDKDDYYEALCQNLLEVLIINMVRRANVKLEIIPVRKVNKECVFIENYINEHFKENITLDLLSELTYINKYYLVHAFKKHKGISPINYLLQKRIEEAKVLLETTNLRINDIANIIGFSSQSYFTQAFKRYEQLSPQQYRIRHL